MDWFINRFLKVRTGKQDVVRKYFLVNLSSGLRENWIGHRTRILLCQSIKWLSKKRNRTSWKSWRTDLPSGFPKKRNGTLYENTSWPIHWSVFSFPKKRNGTLYENTSWPIHWSVFSFPERLNGTLYENTSWPIYWVAFRKNGTGHYDNFDGPIRWLIFQKN